MKIRKGTINDYDEILKLQRQLEAAEVIFDNNLTEKCYYMDKGKEKLRKRIEDKEIIFLVATNKENKVVGFIDGKVPADEWWYKDIVAYLNHLCVDMEYRKRGIAQLLLNYFEQEVKKKGAKYIRLLAFPNNIPAISFYKKNDFIEYSTYYNKKIKQ